MYSKTSRLVHRHLAQNSGCIMIFAYGPHVLNYCANFQDLIRHDT